MRTSDIRVVNSVTTETFPSRMFVVYTFSSRPASEVP